MKKKLRVENKEFRESHLRSIFKGITWRIIATSTTAIIAYGITGELEYALKIGSIEAVTKFGLFYFHERMWQLVPRGTVRKILKKIKRTIIPSS